MAKLASDTETVAMTKVIVAVNRLEKSIAEAIAGLPADIEARVRAWIASRYPALPVPPGREQPS
jgi:hypothetical protein